MLAGVVEVKHRGHRIDTEPVDVELLQPEHGIADEEIADLVAAEVENQRAPVGMLALTGIGVLVESGAVEAGEAVGVFGKVRGDPVDDDPDAALVTAVHELAELVGRTEAARRGKVTATLVAPRPVKGELRHRHQLDVSIAHVRDIIDELVGEFEVAEKAIPVVEATFPRTEMDLVDRHGAVVGIGFCPLRHPVAVFPLVAIQVVNDARGLGSVLGEKGKGITLHEEIATRSDEFEFVVIAGDEVRDEDLPDPVVIAHRVDTTVPAVEVTNDADPVGIGRPDGEGNSLDALVRTGVGSHRFP